MKYITLLRGINVSGQKKLAMRDLASLYESLGFGSITTYIQSGNVIFTSIEKNVSILKNTIERAIEQKYKFHVPVEIRTHDELKNIIKNCPFGEIDLSINGTKVMLTFLSATPSKATIDSVMPYLTLAEELRIIGKEVYLYCPQGYGKTKLSNNFLEKKLDLTATTRNWKTILKLYELSID